MVGPCSVLEVKSRHKKPKSTKSTNKMRKAKRKIRIKLQPNMKMLEETEEAWLKISMINSVKSLQKKEIQTISVILML